MDETKVPPQKIKVVDRRKFTSDGDPRTESPASQDTNVTDRNIPPPPSPGQPAAESHQKPQTPSSPTGMPGDSSSRFVELVAMLASQAELLLVGAEGLPAQPVEAQRLIDYLGVLETKTSGNLTEEESRVISNILYHLRSLYLQKTS